MDPEVLAAVSSIPILSHGHSSIAFLSILQGRSVEVQKERWGEERGKAKAKATEEEVDTDEVHHPEET